MRTARITKSMSVSGPRQADPLAPEKVSASGVATVAEPPSWLRRAQPKGIARVPTHAVRHVAERRCYTRAKLSLPLRVKRIAGHREDSTEALRTANISSSGVFFLYPERIEPGTPIEIEVCLVDRPFGRGSVRMTTEAHVVRVEESEKPGWHGLAVTFDDVRFQRDEPLPARFGNL